MQAMINSVVASEHVADMRRAADRERAARALGPENRYPSLTSRIARAVFGRRQSRRTAEPAAPGVTRTSGPVAIEVAATAAPATVSTGTVTESAVPVPAALVERELATASADCR